MAQSERLQIRKYPRVRLLLVLVSNAMEDHAIVVFLLQLEIHRMSHLSDMASTTTKDHADGMACVMACLRFYLPTTQVGNLLANVLHTSRCL